MTNRELLELAAKAAGLTWEKNIYQDERTGLPLHHDGHGHITYWNPLTDDGDALRLAVKLAMSLHIADSSTLDDGEQAFSLAIATTPLYVEAAELHDRQGKDAATRLAIFRVAAAIGEQKP